MAQKPEYPIGSSVKLKLTDNKKSTTAKVWSLAANDIIDDSVDLINDEELLNDEDRAKPNPESLKVCATTKQRKACANCSCGLAEELEKEAIDNIRKNTQNAKSSCGSVGIPQTLSVYLIPTFVGHRNFIYICLYSVKANKNF
jgi:hypothetical protein